MMVAETKAPASGEPAGARRTASDRPSDQIVALNDRGLQAPSLLDEEEFCAVIEALLLTHGPATEEQIILVASWANRVRCEATVLGLVLAGRVGISLDGGDELVFVAKAADHN